jgi:hypothetical protein
MSRGIVTNEVETETVVAHCKYWRSVRLAVVETLREPLTIGPDARKCRLLQVSRSGFNEGDARIGAS